MDASLDISTISLFLVFVLPGLISMHVYRLIMPAEKMEWDNAIVQGLFLSCVNFALCLPLIIFISRSNFQNQHPIWYGLIGLVILLVGPIVWPLILSKLFRSKKLMSKLMLPFPTSWDFFFDKRIPVFMLIHLEEGKLIGGYFGAKSYATAYPHDGDIYLEAVYSIDEKGKFGKPINDSGGLLIRKDQYKYIELFNVPK